MLYVVHEEGRITQSNKLYQFTEKDYDGRLHDLGYTFIKRQSDDLPSPDAHYVNGAAVKERPVFGIKVSRTRIKAGGKDAALLTKIPRKAAIRIFALGELLHELTNFNELELTIPVPCTYHVMVSLFPYRDFSVAIEAF